MTEVYSEDNNDDLTVISRRRHERVTARGRVSAIADFGSEEYALEILEVSPAGLRLRTPDSFQADRMELVATIDGFSPTIALSTYVRWQEEDDQGYTLFGVEIDDSDDSDVETWCAFQREEWFRQSN